MKEDKDISGIDLLIGKHISGNSTPEEMNEILQWLEASADNRTYYAQYQMLWFNGDTELHKENQSRWEHLQSRIQDRETIKQEKESIILDNKERITKILRIAATFILLVGISAIFYFINKSSGVSGYAQNILEVPYGSRSNLTLPDGTKLWVNSGSKLTYNNGYGKNNRDIYLIGEAYFDVAKNRKLPFVVHAQNLKIKALGTSFNVKAYPDENKVETTLVHGLIEIEKQGIKNPYYLKPSQKLVFSDPLNEKSNSVSNQGNSEESNKLTYQENNANVVLSKEIDTEKETSWKEGKLVFDREPLSSLTIKLERRYDVHFIFEKESLKNYKYTGTFKDLLLDQILEAMHYSSPIDFTIKEKEVFLKER